MAEEKYVLKHEYEADKSQIYRKINAEKADTNEKINAQDKLLHVFIESQTTNQEGFKGVKNERVTLNSNMSDFKESVSEHGRRIQNIEDTASAKSKHNTTIWVAIIGGVFGLLTTALGLAQFLF